MKTNTSSMSMTKAESGRSLIGKMLLASLIITLLFASLPAAGASAAPASAGNSAQDEALEASWSDKIRNVRAAGLFYLRVRVYPADFDDPEELARAHDLLNQYGVALRAAQRVIFNQAGFNINGRVTNENLAAQSLKDVAAYLQEMRGLLKKLNELDGKYRLLPASAVTGTASQ